MTMSIGGTALFTISLGFTSGGVCRAHGHAPPAHPLWLTSSTMRIDAGTDRCHRRTLVSCRCGHGSRKGITAQSKDLHHSRGKIHPFDNVEKFATLGFIVDQMPLVTPLAEKIGLCPSVFLVMVLEWSYHIPGSVL